MPMQYTAILMAINITIFGRNILMFFLYCSKNKLRLHVWITQAVQTSIQIYF